MKKRLNGITMYIVLAISVVVFIAVAYQGLSKLSAKSQQLVDLKLESRKVDSQQTNLAAAKKQLLKYSYFNDVVKQVLPNDKDQAQAVLDINQMAKDSGISLQNITFPASNLGVRGSSSSASTSTPGTSSTSSSSSTSTVKSTLSQAKSVPGISGLYSLQLTITPQTGNQVSSDQATTYPKFLDFLNRIEHDRRTAQISQIEIQPQANSPYMGFTLTLNIFIKP